MPIDFYNLLRPLLFSLPPETAHSMSLRGLDILERLKLTSLFPSVQNLPRTVMGIEFPNPIGLAAGLDKNAAHLSSLAALGFGFLEVGTVTPRPQGGNPKPRLFRLPEERAIINRMGFNNVGLDEFVQNLKATKYRGVLGANIGKNASTPPEEAVNDYVTCLRAIYPYASYIVVNVSSPNTAGLRSFQAAEWLTPLLSTLKREQAKLAESSGRYVPLAVKVAPDLSEKEIEEISEVVLAQSVDGLIATNTTVSREGVEHHASAKEAGGLSGKPLTLRSRGVIRKFSDCFQGRVPIIGSGGVMSAEDALALFDHGASLVQVYTGLIYNGPKLLQDISKQLKGKGMRESQRYNFANP